MAKKSLGFEGIIQDHKKLYKLWEKANSERVEKERQAWLAIPKDVRDKRYADADLAERQAYTSYSFW